jgi:hypothetical protein
MLCLLVVAQLLSPLGITRLCLLVVAQLLSPLGIVRLRLLTLKALLLQYSCQHWCVGERLSQSLNNFACSSSTQIYSKARAIRRFLQYSRASVHRRRRLQC